MQSLERYVSEKHFYQGKDDLKCRIFHDDCAILHSAENFRVIAARGIEKWVGLPFFDSVLKNPDARRRLNTFLKSGEKYLLLPFENQSLLFLSAWYEWTSLVPVFLLHASEKDVRQMLNFASRDAFSSVFRVANEPQADEASLREQLAEIFYYLDGLISPTCNYWTHCRMLAAFFGCRLEKISMPFDSASMSEPLFHRVTAFLVCILLTLRHRTGELSAHGAFSGSIDTENVGKVQVDGTRENPFSEMPASAEWRTDFLLRVEQASAYEPKAKSRTQTPDPVLDALSSLSNIPAFRNFQIIRENGTVSFEARMDVFDSLRAHSLEIEIPLIRFSFSIAC
ncbi:MAG: hypothetical protein IJW29_09835 [Clostridia bacterium]|nr:hypothetical protein [Clostridia bacterium]MBQ9785789.1 hypothetical protein [Clostridia bacterium]